MLLVQFNVNLFDYENLANQYFEHQISIFRSFIFNNNIIIIISFLVILQHMKQMIIVLTRTKTSIRYAKQNEREKRERRREREKGRRRDIEREGEIRERDIYRERDLRDIQRESERERHRALPYRVCALVEILQEISQAEK